MNLATNLTLIHLRHAFGNLCYVSTDFDREILEFSKDDALQKTMEVRHMKPKRKP